MNNNNVAIYCRLSAEDLDKLNKGDDSESIQNQKLLLMDYAINQNFSVHKVYSDDDYSGLDRNRPQFKQMIKDAEQGLFNIILCKTQSRFTRDMEMVEKYIHGLFVLWGIRFISIVDNVDTSIKGNKKSRQINALINEWYCEDLSENIRMVFKKKMQDGQFLGSFAPFGYMKSPEDRHKLIIDNEAAEVVREIFNLYLQGFGCVQISNILIKKGVQTPSVYKKQKGLKFETPNCSKYSGNFGIWSNNTIKRILKNETYIGHLIQGRERKLSFKSSKVIIAPKDEWVVLKNNHEPIIDEKTFNTVQTLMSNKRNVHKPQNGYKGMESSHVLAGKVVCLDCGSSLHRGTTGRNGTRYLRCKLSKKTKSKQCTPHSINLDQLVEIIEEKIRAVIQTYFSNDKNASAVIDLFLNINDNIKILKAKEKEIKTCEAKIQEIIQTLAHAYTDKVKGVISELDFINLKQVFDMDSDNYKNKKFHLESEIKEMNINYTSIKDVDQILNKYLNFDSLTHEIVNDFIDNIQVGEKDETGEQIVIINWLF